MRNGVINVNLQTFSPPFPPQHLRPCHELQQHRSFASTAEDGETDKHKKSTTGGEWVYGMEMDGDIYLADIL